MNDVARNDVWALGSAYELYVGRWSRRVADAFLAWISSSRIGSMPAAARARYASAFSTPRHRRALSASIHPKVSSHTLLRISPTPAPVFA